MNKLSDQISKLINEQSASGVLTPSVLKQMNEISEDSIKISEQNRALREELDKAKAEIKNVNKAYDLMSEDFKKLKDREQSLLDREKEITKLELRAEYEAIRVADHASMFSIVFRNTEIRRTVLGSAVAHDGSGYPMTVPQNETETKEEV
jgi:predicted RNase H-like nuclease (RuvC/YqgF family)